MSRRRARVRVASMEDGVRVTVGPLRGGWDIVGALLTGPLLILTWVALASAPLELTRGTLPPAGALLFVAACWVGMWVLSGWFALALLFRLVGREAIVVTDTELTSTIVILGLRRTRRFSASQIKNVRFYERHYRAKGAPMIRRTVAFDYEGKEETLVSQLSPEDGRALVSGPLQRFAGS